MYFKYVILGVRLEVRRREQGVGATEQAGQGLHQDQWGREYQPGFGGWERRSCRPSGQHVLEASGMLERQGSELESPAWAGTETS